MPETPENKHGTLETTQEQHHLRLRRLRLAGALGLATLTAFAAAMSGVEPSNQALGIDSSQTLSSMAHTSQAETTPVTAPTPEAEIPTPDEENRSCTSIRTRAKYLYLGWACLEKGDTYAKVSIPGDNTKKSGWVYAAVRLAVPGPDIVKCGVIRKKVIPTGPARSGSVSKCRKYYPDLVKKGTVYVDDHNCEPIKNGYDPCVDAAPPYKPSSTCPDPHTYRNFESDNPSPINVFGTGPGGFREVITENTTASLRYRVRFTIPASNGVHGIVVRAPEWGWSDNRCVKEENREGGPLKVEVNGSDYQRRN